METEIMNHKQKIGYTALGAFIMLIGIGIGTIVVPPLTAQHNGTFDQIECREILVCDPDGNRAIRLASNRFFNEIELFDKTGKVTVNITQDNSRRKASVIVGDRDAVRSVGLTAADVARLTMWDENDETMISLSSWKGQSHYLWINDENADTGIALGVNPRIGNSISLQSPESGSNGSIFFRTHKKYPPLVEISSSPGNIVWEAP